MTRLALGLVLALGVCEPAFAHHWYEGDCCDKDDCRPAHLGELRWTPDGWLHVPTNFLVPEDRVRSIPDHAPMEDKLQMHLCPVNYNIYQDGEIEVPKGAPRCVYQGELAG